VLDVAARAAIETPMTSRKANLASWRRRFKAVDWCPWPGPRPLGKNDSSLLVGRVPIRREFRRVMQSHRLVLLHGPSGIGKSSLLQAGLIDDLSAEGSTVLSNDQWGGMPHDDVRGFLAAKFGLNANGADPFAELATSHGGRAVLVLDQFEELVRYSPRAANLVFDLVVDLNRRYDTKIVISFRSEYLHDFSDLEKRVVNFTHTQLPLPELPDDAAENVVLAGNKSQKGGGVVDKEAATRLATAWISARETARAEAAGDDPFSRIGLLHLQAMLYALYFSLDKAPLTLDSVSDGLNLWRAQGLATNDLDGDAFRFALQQSVDFKLAHCEQAGLADDGEPLLDPLLTDGTRWMLERTVPHLSSAGYKLIRDARELAQLALGSDHEALADGLARQSPLEEEQERGLFEILIDSARLGQVNEEEAEEEGYEPSVDHALKDDLLISNRSTLAAAADSWLTANSATPVWSSRLAQAGSAAHDNDPLGVTCGPMFGLTPSDVLVEEFRRYAFALVWLEESALVRITTPAGSSAMVSLIHDGFGAALRAWSTRRRNSPVGPLAAITAPRGASFPWSDGPTSPDVLRPPTLSGDSHGTRLIPNLRWRGGYIQADLAKLAFLNCDFRGTTFDGCLMSGVTFVNCLLDGAIFSECTFTGPQADAALDDGWSEDEPDFVVDASPALTSVHRAYRSMTGEAKPAFLCDLPGAPAIPYEGQDASTTVVFSERSRPAEVRRLEATLVDGGVAVLGSRISTLVLRRCRFEADSGFAIRHSTGSGFELVEVVDTPGRLEFFGCAVRQLTVSSTPLEEESPRVRVEVRGCTVAQVYVGAGLRGSFVVENSFLAHAWNAGPGDGDSGVHFLARNCTVHGTLDVDLSKCTAVGSGPQSERIDTLGVARLEDRMTRMDYRRNPAQLRARRTETV
jgi:hypothetical protein